MKRTVVFIFTLAASFLLAYFTGRTVFLYGTFTPNPQLKQVLARILSTIPSPSPTVVSLPVLPTLSSATSVRLDGRESLAYCLKDRGFLMYGTASCSACQLQRQYFGESFSLIPYVDCDLNKELCQGKNIRSYPTWEDSNGKKYKGAIPLDELAKLSGCPPPM